MWLWLLIQLAPIRPAVNSAWALETGSSNGPVSTEEGRILWEDGRKAFQEGRYKDAIPDLQRLIDRYPGFSGYLEAHRFLGRALMLVGQFKAAESPLKYYVDATGTRPLGLRTQLWLGEVYWMTSRANEAYLTSLRVEKETRKTTEKSGDPELYAESQFLKTHALIALNQIRRAQQTLDSIELDAFVQSDPVLKGHLSRAEIELKLQSCARLPRTGAHLTLDEGQVRDQFSQRSSCLQQALILFKAAAESHDEETIRDAERRITEAYGQYAEAVQNPPSPPRLKPTDRTTEQKEQYKAELTHQLQQDRKKAVQDVAATLATWRSRAEARTPVDSRAAASYSEISKQLETPEEIR